MSKLFNFLINLSLVALLITLILVMTDRLPIVYACPISAFTMLVSWAKILCQWRKGNEPLRKLHIFELIGDPLAIFALLYIFWNTL